jgi:heat shock protein HtpX
MANLYRQAESNTRRTWMLMIVLMILIIGLGWFLSYLFETWIILIIAIIWSFGMNFFAYWQSDKLVLRMMRAKPVTLQEEPELYRLTENLAITSGLPMPRLYIMEENQPNAFATGRDEKHATVVVTRGLMNKLDRSELEGVVAHELAHIKNKDILLGTVIIVLVGAIAMISNLALRMSFYRGNRSKDNNLVILIVGLVGLVLAPLAAAVIKASVSRRREFLADASGALLTRYPEGLAKALAKISSDSSQLSRADTSSAHLFIASPFKEKQSKNWMVGLFSTHPPVEERIRRLMEKK